MDKAGNARFRNDPTSPVMGDTWRLNGPIQAGSASDRGGLRTGDSFPTTTPWMRSVPLDPARDWPPFSVWEGDLRQGEDVVVLLPTIWEWDPGQNTLQGWLKWAYATVDKLGPKAAELIGGNPKAVIDAVSLGLTSSSPCRSATRKAARSACVT
jgi:hypothetical protein